MFSTGQVGFAIFFVVAFVAIISYSYRRDFALHKFIEKKNPVNINVYRVFSH
jgi:hypothetical protein